MLDNHLRTIKGIKFSEREIDILSCILHMRGAKKIANILQISYRTVERHIQNIMLKIACNSQDAIKDFIETSENHLHIKKHYTSLLIDAFFQNQLLKISTHAKNKKLTFNIINGGNFKQANKKIIKHLELAGLKHDLNNAKIQIILQKNAPPKTTQTVLSIEKYYINFFEILAANIPDIDFSKFVEEFETLSKNTNNVREEITNQLINNIQNNVDLTIPRTKDKSYNKYLILAITGICIILSTFLLKYFSNNIVNTPTVISSDLHIPHASNYLQRPDILNNLNKRVLENKDPIKIFTLTGIGGSGKTTITRQYARESSSNTIWEINCASKEAIYSAFEDFAQALCSTSECINELNAIQNTNDAKKRQKLISTFVAKKLITRPNWLLIFDNAETIKEIKPYLPSNPKIWGNGTIFITTRNTNSISSSYIDENNIINIGPLEHKEKLHLFKKIASNVKTEDVVINNFLNEIPSYPLDISIAAYYLKEHNTPFKDYLNYINTLPLSFIDAQKNILHDVGEYTNTRYAIITLSLQKILKQHPAYFELMLYIALINVTDIPHTLLLYNQDELITNNFIHELKKYSLIQELSKNSLQLHKSTQQIILDFLVQNKNLQLDHSYTGIITENFYQFTMESLEDDNIELIRILTTHAERLGTHPTLLSKTSQALLDISLGSYYFYLSNNNKAEKFLENGVKNLAQNLQLANAQIMLGNVYTNTGKYKKAENIFKQAIQSFINIYDANDYHVAWAKVSLGRLYIKIGQYDQAKIMLTEAYQTYQNYYGKEHPETAWVMFGMSTF